MSDHAIGIIDAGFGGLAEVRAVQRLMPGENIIYYSDMMHFPYDKENKCEVDERLRSSAEFLADRGVKLIINACDCIGHKSPEIFAENIPCVDLQLPAAQAACSCTKNGRIGLMGSAASVQNGIIGKAVKTIRPGTVIAGSVSPLIIPAVIGDYVHRNPSLLRAVIDECTSDLKNAGVDTIIMCSPCCEFIAEQISESAGSGITIVSPVNEAAKAAELLLFEHGLLSDSDKIGSVEYIINGNEEFFTEHTAKLCSEKINITIIG